MEDRKGEFSEHFDTLAEDCHVQTVDDRIARPVATVAKTPAELGKAKQLNWADERGHWRVLKWNPLQKELQVDESKPTVPTEDIS